MCRCLIRFGNAVTVHTYQTNQFSYRSVASTSGLSHHSQRLRWRSDFRKMTEIEMQHASLCKASTSLVDARGASVPTHFETSRHLVCCTIGAAGIKCNMLKGTCFVLSVLAHFRALIGRGSGRIAKRSIWSSMEELWEVCLPRTLLTQTVSTKKGSKNWKAKLWWAQRSTSIPSFQPGQI